MASRGLVGQQFRHLEALLRAPGAETCGLAVPWAVWRSAGAKPASRRPVGHLVWPQDLMNAPGPRQRNRAPAPQASASDKYRQHPGFSPRDLMALRLATSRTSLARCIGLERASARPIGLRSISTESTANSYEILGLKRNATQLEIKSKYLQLVKELHPDLFFHGDQKLKLDKEQKFIAVQKAFDDIMAAQSGRAEVKYYNPSRRDPKDSNYPVFKYMIWCIVIGTGLFVVVVEWWNSGVADDRLTALQSDYMLRHENQTKERKARMRQQLVDAEVEQKVNSDIRRNTVMD